MQVAKSGVVNKKTASRKISKISKKLIINISTILKLIIKKFSIFRIN